MIMKRLSIEQLARRQIRALSGGQQQRVFLGRALISNPRLLLLDEPTAGVDIKTRDDILHLLDELNHDGVTVVMSTHELNAVAAHLPWVVCVNRSIVAQGSPADVYTPANLKRTYGADMAVIQYEGMTLVAEAPHKIGRARHSHQAGTPGREHSHAADGSPHA
jgi:zinc/manganese transport system ATP-binding protein